MTLQQLIYVVTVSDETSMNRAAQRLYLAQSSLSAGIHSLEEELGFSLFRRSNRGVVPTPEGEEFLAMPGRSSASTASPKSDSSSSGR